MKDLIIWSHIISGSLVLLIGLVIMIIPKGGKTHVYLGWAYVICMWWVCLSAFVSIAFYTFSMFLLVIGILTFYSTFQGIRVIRRSEQFQASWYDYLVSGIVTCAGLILVGFAFYILLYQPGNIILAGLSLLFGALITQAAAKDIKHYLSKCPNDKNWWLYQHVNSMGGSYIAAVTALAVQNGELFSIPGSLSWLPWVLPGAAGGLIVGRVIQKLKNRREPNKTTFV